MGKTKVGAKPKYKDGVKTKTIHRLIPIGIENQVIEFINKASKPYLTKQ